jgi:hypothetical protein
MRNVLIAFAAMVLIASGVFAGRYTKPTPIEPTPVPTATIAPTATAVIVTSAGVVREIQHLNRLESTQYSIETVATAEIPPNKIGLGGEKLLAIFRGRVSAGVDLSKLESTDITISADGKSISVKLPAVEIFHNALDESKTRIYEDKQGWFAKHNTELETEARQKAVVQVLASACEDGLIAQAEKDSKSAVESLVSALGFTTVNVSIAEPAADICPAPSAVATPAP